MTIEEAAKLVREGNINGFDAYSLSEVTAAHSALAAAYLAEHPSDDNEVPTPEWIESVGIDEDTIDSAIDKMFNPNPPPPDGTPLMATKRQVRAFCYALNVQLNEPSNG